MSEGTGEPEKNTQYNIITSIESSVEIVSQNKINRPGTSTTTPPLSLVTDTAGITTTPRSKEEEEVEEEEKGNFSSTVVHSRDFRTGGYVSRKVTALTSDNLQQTIFTLEQVTAAATCACIETRRNIERSFLSQLFEEFLLHFIDTHHRKEQTEVLQLPSFLIPKFTALQQILKLVAHQSDLTTVICSSLQITLSSVQKRYNPNTKRSNDQQLLSLLHQFLRTPSSHTSSENSHCTASSLFDSLSGLTFAVSILSGFKLFDLSLTSQSIQFVNQYLLFVLLEEKEQGVLLTSTLQQIILCTILTIQSHQQQLYQPIINKLQAMSNNNNPSSSLGMAEQLSHMGQSLGVNVANLLAELGPSTTASSSTLRDTLFKIVESFSKAGGSSLSKPASLDEESVARLIYFFSDMGTRKQGNENGSVSSSSSSTLVQTLTDNQVATGSNWNLSAVQEVISQDYSNLNWDTIAKKFDFRGFFIRDLLHFNVFLSLYKAGASNKTFPFEVLVSRWENKSGQLSLIERALSVLPSVYPFPLSDEESIDASTAGDTSATNILNPRGWASARVLQLLLEMSNYAEDNINKRVKELFVHGLLSCPEVLICALFRLFHSDIDLSKVGAELQSQLTRELLRLFFKPPNRANHPVRNAAAAIRRLWAIDNNTVIGGCIEGWRTTANESPQSRLMTIIHVINIIRNLPENSTAVVLNGNKDHEFSVSVAFIMADNDILQLRAWLNSRISANNGGFQFVLGAISYIGRNIPSALPRLTAVNNNDGKAAPLVSYENLVLTIQILRMLDASILGQEVSSNSNEAKPQTLGDRVKLLGEACVSAHPSLSSVLAQQENNQTGGNSVQTNNTLSSTPEDIEEMANSYFQKIYTSEQSIDEVVNMLKRFKTSGTQRENDIFACMIHNLFDEYRFFSKYPEKELRITGILFGKLIQHQLVSSITLGIALRYVLEALRKPPGAISSTTSNSGKMFRFGMFALEQFKERLNEWPQYCSHIVQIPHLKEGYKALVEEIEGAMVETQNRNPSSASVGSGHADSNSEGSGSNKVPTSVDVKFTQPTASVSNSAMPVPVPVPVVQRVAKFGPGLGRAVNNNDEDVQHEAPPDTVLDRVQFLINNVTMSNVENKSADLKELLEPTYFGWLGHYLVVKRISTQPNFHSVYLAFLEHLGDYGKGLIDAILSSVYMNVGKLLRSPKITTSTSERSLLKNLGSWLGQITLARNKPILQITLDCKELLYQGYENGMLIAVTPFVAKILEGAKSSIVFRPPNPWLMGLLSVFRALYGVDDLKMNIKFEVEVLCKNLGVKLEDIPLRSDDLSKRIAPVKTRNPDFTIKNTVSSQSPAPNNASIDGTQGGDGKPTIVLANSGLLNATSLQVGQPPSASTSQDQQHTVIPNLASYVSIDAKILQLFQQFVAANGNNGNLNNTTLKRSVPIAVDRAIREIIQPVVERSVTIACITTKEIVTKDFAMEGDENKMMKAAQLMVANLAGSLALVTCREPLRASVSTHLRQLLISSITGGNTEAGSQLGEKVQNVIDQCVTSCSQDNLDLGCVLIEKAATEKAVRDMEEAIAPALQARKKHREQTGQQFYDMSIFNNGNQYPASLPEPLLPKPGGLRNEQLHVYEAFQRISRQPSVTSQQQNLNPNTSNVEATVSASTKFNMDAFTRVALNLENSITTVLKQAGQHRAPEIVMSRLSSDHEVVQLLHASKQMATSVAAGGNISSEDQNSILIFAQNIFKRLYDMRLSEPLRLEAFVGLLDALNECCPQLSKEIGTWATYAPTESDGQRKLHRTVLLLLLRSNLLQVMELDAYLSERIDKGRNVVWVEFTMAFIRTALREKIVNPKDLPKVLKVLNTLSTGGSHSNQISQLLSFLQEVNGTSLNNEEKGRSTPDNVAATVSGLNALVGKPDKPTYQQSSSISIDSFNNLAGATKRALKSIESIASKDPSNLNQQVTLLLDGWMRLNSGDNSNKNVLQFVQLLQQNGIGKNEEQTERFFRVATEVLVKAVLQNAKVEETKSHDQTVSMRQLNYTVVDSYGKLVSVLVRHLNSGGSSEQIASQRISLLNQLLGVTMRTMMADYERAKRDTLVWDQRPWFRLLLNLVMDLNAPSSTLDPISYGILSVFGSAFHVVQPLVIPGFAFAWLELVSHRMFLSNLLLVKGQKGWALAHQLLIDLFLFLEPHLRKTELTNSIRHLYKGTMRVLLVLLHDFPTFLSGYHLSFCNVIPENCVQLRNVVLSAFTRGMVLPDPFMPNLKIDLLPEISKSPVVLSNVVGPLNSMRDDLDQFLSTRQPSDFVKNLLPRLYKNGSQDIDSPRVNSLVLYVGMHAIAKMQNSNVSQSLTHSAEIEILQKLMDFNDRGRYICLNAIANQLRYPSSHTHYFSCVILYLFSEAKDEGIREQITRVLLERLIVHRPHPWGLLVTFIELIKNQRYQFWSHPFTRCATEIEKVFESVARSLRTPGTQRSAPIVGGDGSS